MWMAFRIKHNFARRSDNFWLWLVGLLPRTVIMWAAVRLIAHATMGKYGNTDPGTLDVMTALKRWEGPN